MIPSDVNPALQSCDLTGTGDGQLPTCMRTFQTICSPVTEFESISDLQATGLPS
jgi:hypothetical protein